MTPLPVGTDVATVLGRLGIDGRAQGTRFWALCPYHQDHSPTNFMVRLDGDRRGNFICYSCKAKGDLYHLVQHVLQVDFRVAREWLSDEKAKDPPGGVRFVARLPGPRRFELPPEVVIAPLSEWIMVAASYVVSRGIVSEQVDRWRLGYAVGGRLDGRVVFPVYSRGRPVGYTARTFVGDPRRYLAADERENPDPGAIFGEEFWPPREKRDSVCVLEGAINALAVERVAPLLPLAALGGSNPTPQRVNKLATFRRVYVLTDPDPAGKKASTLLTQALARYAEVCRIEMAPGYDPADLPPQDLRALLRQASLLAIPGR